MLGKIISKHFRSFRNHSNFFYPNNHQVVAKYSQGLPFVHQTVPKQSAIQAALSSATKNNSKICLLGDFSFPHIKWKNDGIGEPKSYDDTIFCETLGDLSF